MGPAFYIMAILGCGDAQATCRDVRTLAIHYPTADACAMATGTKLQENSDIDFPVVMAECRQGGTRLASAE
jgi:hypothetical protein